MRDAIMTYGRVWYPSKSWTAGDLRKVHNSADAALTARTAWTAEKCTTVPFAALTAWTAEKCTTVPTLLRPQVPDNANRFGLL